MEQIIIDKNKVLDTINVLQAIQENFIQEYIKENPEHVDEDYIECEQVEEIQNTIYILENVLEDMV